MADGQQTQIDQTYNANDYFLKQQAARMLNAIQKGYDGNFSSQETMTSSMPSNQQVSTSLYMDHSTQHQQQQPSQQMTQQQIQQVNSGSQDQLQVHQQQLQQQLQQVQKAQQQFQQMQQLAQMQQQFQHPYNPGNNIGNAIVPQAFPVSRRGRRAGEQRRKRKRHTWVKRPTTAYLYFVSKYRETLKEAGEVVPKAKIITQACAEKWRNMNEEEKEPFLELSRRDRERWEKDKALEKKPRDPNRPKRPPSAYFLFLAVFRKQFAGKANPAKEITKKAGEAWNNLTDEEKAPYYRDAQIIRTQWERDLETYKQEHVAPLDKSNDMARNPSMDADCKQLQDIDAEASPLQAAPSNSHDLRTDMLQGPAMMALPENPNYSVKPPPHSVPSVETGTMPASSMSYSTFTHPVAIKPTDKLQYPGR